MEEWAEKWKMEFNVGKCKVMHVGRRNEGYDYKMGGMVLKKTEVEKDLGVMIGSDMKPEVQCEAAAKKARKVWGQITRAFHFRKKEILLPLYKMYVRPHLEYAGAVWGPWMEKDWETLEKVQRMVIKMMTNWNTESYEERISEVGLPTAKERRRIGDQIETFKIIKRNQQCEERRLVRNIG